jgi:hypothetical protein
MDLSITHDTLSRKHILHIVFSIPSRSSKEFPTRKPWVVIGVCCGIICSRGYDELWGIGLIIIVRELINSYIYMSPNYRIVTLVPFVGAASAYITISSTLTITAVISMAYVAILAVPKVATSRHWFGGLDNAGLASPSTLHHTPIRKITHPNACYQSLELGCQGWNKPRREIIKHIVIMWSFAWPHFMY